MSEKLSKLLSYVLRHRPDEFGLELGDGGWVSVDALLFALEKSGRGVAREQLEAVVHTSDKRRFAFSDDGLRIRANQGHSAKVDLQLQASEPPERLFHGTVQSALAGIRAQGLLRGKRHHVHLSPDRETASAVGSRRGQPLILLVESKAMSHAGHEFYLSANGVWLTNHVPVRFIRFAYESEK